MRSLKGNGAELKSASVTLTSDKNYQSLVEIEVPGNAYTFQKGVQQYAVLQAHFPQKLLEKQVLLTFQTGHIFIQTDKTIYTPDSTDMVPSFRFVTYYHVGSNEGVSDSVWVDVKDMLMGSLKVEVRDPLNIYAPDEKFGLKLTRDPGAKVGLVAVDKGVYVLNNNRLTQSKIWDVVEKQDTGCTAGSGREDMQVFSGAGLLFESSTAGGTGEMGEFVNSDSIVTRTLFPESWLWEEVRVELKETEDVCSLARNKGRYQIKVTVDAKSSRSVPFVIIPLAFGRHSIEVKAAVAGRGGDGMKKDLLVGSEGVLTKLGENLRLSPSKKGKQKHGRTHKQRLLNDTITQFLCETGGQHVQVIKSLILKDQAPNTPAVTYITGTGDPISITIEKAISGAAMGSLVIQPGGCGEQNMIGLTMPVIATHYLDRANQWHTVSAGLRQRALTYITRDGSHWPVPGSIYFSLEATAYALLAFVKAKDFQRAAPIVTWLNNQRQYNGGYGTTQATIMVFQAVAEYRIQVKDVKLLNMEVTIQVAGSQLPVVWRFNQENGHLTQQRREITIIAKGSGEASVTVVTEYYAKAKEKNTECKNFELELMFEKENRVTYSGASERYKLTINTSGQYALGERTWLEHWPSKDESNTSAELKEKYNGMLSLQHDLLFGCPKP
ncbi:Complement C3 [Triplophysa tibetana]|uniref:Complement C3 n=1 Tax=Triplophysa tibetana TaxID=1572043 RepID=A0A5A9PJI3_9TELE|nr:Complement C3 [Triplophysa tibetana]